MSNIVTQQLRLVLRAGARASGLDVDALVEQMLGERGSYWVPPVVDASRWDLLDVQLGSGKGAGLVHVDPEALRACEEIWMRTSDDGADLDTIASFSPLLGEDLLDARWRPCRYALDRAELVVGGASRALVVAGTYAALNTRTDMTAGASLRLAVWPRVRAGALTTPTTPCVRASPPTDVQPVELARALAAADAYTLTYRGRVVQRAERDTRGGWAVQSADHWDNCADDEYQRVLGKHLG